MPSSTRATSRMRTDEPSARARSTTLPNSSGVSSWPLGTVMVALMVCPGMLGVSPSEPPAICMLWLVMALLTSAAVRP